MNDKENKDEDNLILSQDQKSYIRTNFKNGTDLKQIVSEVWPVSEGESPTDVRSKKGRLVRQFLIAEGFNYKTARTPEGKLITLTDAQKEIIKELLSRGKKSGEIANEVFKEKIKPLSAEHKLIISYISDNPQFLKRDASIVEIDGTSKKEKYRAPQSTGPVVSKINSCTDSKLDEKTMTRADLTCVEKTLTNLNNSRFHRMVNNFNKEEDRTLFEQEFIRMTWNKPDLTAEEVNQYLSLCRDIVNMETTSKHLQKLNQLFEDIEENNELTVKLSEMIKSKNVELNDTNKRIENAIKRLQGDRQQRIAANASQYASFLNIVKAFQEETERERIVKMAMLQAKLVSDEADKLESMDDMKARILGMPKESLI